MHKNPNMPCQQVHSERAGSTITLEVQCKFGGQLTRSKTVMTLSGNIAYHSEIRTTDNTLQSVIDGKYLGPSPAGMVLGDVNGPNGTKVNVLHPVLPASATSQH